MKGLRSSLIVKTALLRPVTMMMVFASVLVLGTVAALDIPLELTPTGFSNPSLNVFVGFGNATPQDVEERISKPLEASLATTPKPRPYSPALAASMPALTARKFDWSARPLTISTTSETWLIRSSTWRACVIDWAPSPPRCAAISPCF